jgi:putative lipoic acid-binding regulatory protein
VSDEPLVSDDAARERAIALLEANHAFPTDYSISVIARNADEVATLVLAAVTDDEVDDERPAVAHEMRPSSGGKYVSHRLTVRCADAEHVLRLYARLRTIDGVMTIL